MLKGSRYTIHLINCWSEPRSDWYYKSVQDISLENENDWIKCWMLSHTNLKFASQREQALLFIYFIIVCLSHWDAVGIRLSTQSNSWNSQGIFVLKYYSHHPNCQTELYRHSFTFSMKSTTFSIPYDSFQEGRQHLDVNSSTPKEVCGYILPYLLYNEDSICFGWTACGTPQFSVEICLLLFTLSIQMHKNSCSFHFPIIFPIHSNYSLCSGANTFITFVKGS